MSDEGPGYAIASQSVLAESADMRFSELVLDPGEEVPWHFHSAVSDWYVCREGTLRVETRAPRQDMVLAPGELAHVSPKTAHRVSNAGEGPCRFALIQGVGVFDFVPVGGG